MDLAYLRAHPEHLATFLTHQRVRETPVGGGAICTARRLTLEDGASVFTKTYGKTEGEPAPEHFFETEADGLRWLGETGTVPVPEVIAALPGMLVLTWVDDADPRPGAAERFGRDLAALHRFGSDAFGAPWPGFIGSLPQDNSGAQTWPEWFATRRLVPYLRGARDGGAVEDSSVVERVLRRLETDGYGQAGEPASRLHGDLWPGNLLWTTDGVTLVDPAAHGGHRETDVAQLHLFGGAPFLPSIIQGYEEVWPLPDGWQARVPLHQLHLALVHAVLFGARYRDLVLSCAQAALRA